jgi:4-hydroxyproline epimerase
MAILVQSIKIIDSHTAGEPTRVVIAGGPDLGNGTIVEKLRLFREKHDTFRSAVVNEPRGSDVIVGALLVEPSENNSAAAVIFFNNVGYLGMCGHGMIGVMETLRFLGRIQPGEHQIETPVGIVSATLHDDGQVSVRNVPSYRYARDVAVNVAREWPVTGDIAWGGNWFYLVTSDHGRRLALENVEELTAYTWRIRQALKQNGITGAGGAEIDHIELFGSARDGKNHSRNFVLCPGKAYDRSPCGTGTSAKLACLFADGKLKPGETWRQESVIGSVFEGSVSVVDGQIIPTIKGSAFVTGETTLLLQEADPFKWGIR